MTAALDPVFTFALTVLLLELTPGPNMAWLAVLSADRGRRAGFSAVLGVMAGLLCIGLLAAIGLAALVERTPWLFGMMRYGACCFFSGSPWKAGGAPERARPLDPATTCRDTSGTG